MEIINWLGFATALFAYFTLILLGIVNKQKSSAYVLFVLFALCGFIWSLGHLVEQTSDLSTSSIIWVESLRLGSTGLLLLSLLNNGWNFNKLLLSRYSIIILLVTIFTPTLGQLKLIGEAWFYIGYLSLTVLSLILLEILYRKADRKLWGLKPLILALGTLLIFDFIIFANASLVLQVNPDMWLARGYLHTALVPLLLWSIKRSKTLGIKVYISREMVFQSSLLLAAGVYLTLMALAGYYIKSIESQWTGMVQSIFVALAFTLLFALFISESLKKNLKVFLEKHFFANQFDYRVQWLNLTNLLNSPLQNQDDYYNRALTVFLFSIEYDVGALYKNRLGKLQAVADKNLQQQNQPNSCEQILALVLPFIEKTNWIVDLKDYQSNSQHYPGLSIPYNLIDNSPFHVVVPIYHQEKLWGVVCLNHSGGEYLNFNWEIRDYMSVVTTQVGHYLFQHEANKQITENAQFAAFSRMSAFVIHDLKNVLAQVDMILANAEKHKHNPEFIDDTFETLGYSKERMEKMLAQLMNKSTEENNALSTINLTDEVAKLIQQRCQNIHPLPNLISETPIEVKVDIEKLTNVLYHLIDNAQQATANDGYVNVELVELVDTIKIKIKDTGIGMSADFIKNKLFKPFVTTKGNAGMGIGAYDAKLYAEQAGGSLLVSSVENQGTEFILELPK
ncbi:sensor signal transduction histidine kinase [Catenovulum agarivorans DS-2]|uniref:histidine kinase n=1 Tax=Catenovulum agarivorans DS-2 TaxID=1328313 RepID=W7R0I9_9ALTE|nr:XrtA/PEP-CTERM system histidine kinase PrsK [Catenovulum agarivorans]EWH11120.1 sensor signal transduction histidine kinase [Catenovulum agarivorans DS-2]